MARKKIQAPKVIADPIYGIFDIRPVLPMVETKEFQSLGDKRQLGMSYLTFPSATHTRRAHSLGAYHATRELADRWIDFGLINDEEANALAGYALYHDIGHPAFSHVTEPLCLKNNDELSLELMQGLKNEIEACDINFRLMLDLASHKNPLYLAVHDKNLGMEKFDYLERDGLYTILSRPAGIDYLRRHIYFVNGELAIDEKVVDNAIEVQNFYLKMYKNVYFRKGSIIAQRMLQKIVYQLILAGEIGPDDLPRITDSELLGVMRFSKSDAVRSLYELLKRRELFREAVVVRPEKFVHAEAKSGKPIAVLGAKSEEISAFASSPALREKNQAGLLRLEQRIASIAGIPPEAVLFVPIISPERFEAKDVMIYADHMKLASLKERYPAHFKNMEEVAQSYVALRVCALEGHRKKLSEPKTAQEIFDLLRQTALA